ncbi:MAG TPA: tRNA lysidine(34) synthetase TilS [Candidatus Limnocylindria bacterium]|nr:tRNA lysidine(34) synthetase TilS [Candidatus Limnocylindria bacterium]
MSGGTDSTALCLILAELRDEFGLVLHVAHFDHRARPRSAAADAAFVGELANHIGATLRVGRADTPPKNEDDARTARYGFLRRVASDIGATAIATGHTRDDQAETVLLHLARGSGLAGLAGMRPQRDGVVRPLLVLRRADTAAVCKAARIKPREDPTNRSLRYARNRVRHRVLPELAKLNPEISAAIARLSDAAAGVADSTADDASAALRTASSGAALDLDRLPDADEARAEALALWWEQRTATRLTSRHRAALARLAATLEGSRSLDLPGGRALREYTKLRCVSRSDDSVDRTPITLARGETADWHGWRFALDRDLRGRAEVAQVDADSVVVRRRKPGDRMSGPRGAKVQDVFTNAKVPARERDAWPLVTVGDAVVWIPGITPPPRTGRSAVRALRTGEDSTGMIPGNRQQVASLREVRPPGEERGRQRT